MKRPWGIIIVAALLILPPLLGGLIDGLRPGFFHYPPLEIAAPLRPDFNPVLFCTFVALLFFSLLLIARPRRFGFRPSSDVTDRSFRQAFPVWGYAGLLLMILSWIMAWTRPDWAGWMNRHWFAPLWFSYVLILDAIAYAGRGHSLLRNHFRLWVWLFPTSALCWWYFEFINRFIRNWWYEGIVNFSPAHYILYASLCFSTVFPALFEATESLTIFPRLRRACHHGPKTRLPRGTAYVLLLGGALLLFLLGRYPVPFFFSTWLAPLLITEGTLLLTGTPGIVIGSINSGNYNHLYRLAIAGLITGVCWETWNYWSLPKWHYSVPYVQALLIFEMPLPGFAGYLPFGPICWNLWLLLRPRSCDSHHDATGFACDSECDGS
jgi:hypothetical protein